MKTFHYFQSFLSPSPAMPEALYLFAQWVMIGYHAVKSPKLKLF